MALPNNTVSDWLSTFQAANNKLIQAKTSFDQLSNQNSASDLLNQATDEQIAAATGGLTRAQFVTSLSLFETKLAFNGSGEATVLYECASSVPQVS